MSTTTRHPAASARADDRATDSPRPTLQLSLPQVVGSALAAATSAVAASFLGVAGTLVGAIVGAVIATIGGALYSHSLGLAALRMRVVRQVSSDDGATLTVDTRPIALAADRGSSPPPGGAGPARTPARRRWVRLSTGVALAVVLALAGITALELLLGHPVSGATSSGTSIGQAVGAAPVPEAPGVTTQTSTASPTSTPSTSPSASATATATESASPTATSGATSSPTGASAAPATTAPANP